MNGTIPESETLWRHPDFRRLWAAQAVSAVGSRITRTAIPIIAINSLGASASAVGALSALAMAPGVIIALFFSGFIDRSAKRPLLIAMDVARGVLLLTLPAAAYLGALTMTHLVVVACLTGAATAVFLLAKTAYLPRLVKVDQLLDGNSKLQSTEAVAEVAGPSIAGILIQAVTAPVAVVADAIAFWWSILWLRRIEAVEATATDTPPEHPLADIAAGWRACRDNPFVFPLLIAQGVFALFAGFFSAIYMIFVLRNLALDEATVGIIIGLGGIGALWGAFAAEPLSRMLGYGRAVVICLGLWVAATMLIPLCEGQDFLKIPFLSLQQLIGDGFLAAFMILAVSIRQTALHPDVLARAGATFQLVEGVSLPVGALIAGSLADVVGPSPVLWAAIGGALIPLAILTLSRLWTLKTLENVRLSNVTSAS